MLAYHHPGRLLPLIQGTPCSWHWAPAKRLFRALCTGKAVTGKQRRTEKHQSTHPFLPPFPSHVYCTSFSCLLDCLFLVGSRGGCGTRTLWPPARASVTAFHTVPLQLAWLQTSTGCLFSLSVCFHWLQSAFLQFFPFLGSQLGPVNTNNINALDVCHSCGKRFSHQLSCGFSLSTETDDTAAHPL